jgi:hypothetical protein
VPAFTNAKPNVPELFKEIMRVDAQLEAELVKSAIPFEAYKLVARKRELMAAAEKALHWNVDKGNTAKV